MQSRGQERIAARDRRFDRHRAKRRPLVGQAASVAGVAVEVAVPVHRRNPAITTTLGAAEVLSFGALALTGSTVALVALAASSLGFLAAHLTDRRAVLAFTADRWGTLLDGGRSGRPTRVLGAAVLDEPLPTHPTGLSTPIRANGVTWWLDRGSYHTLRPSRPD